MQWSAVVPVKRLALAKTRLVSAPDEPLNPALALAFARDTVAAVVATAAVDRVIVVTDDQQVSAAVAAWGAEVLPDVRRGGLNEAVRSGAAYAVGIAGPHPVAALPSDLPALTADWLQAALAAAAEHAWAFVPDATGTGTTLLTATSGDVRPRYGPESAEEHARDGAARLDGDWPGLRQDVDTLEDLLTAWALGLGPATTAVIAAMPLGSASRDLLLPISDDRMPYRSA